MAKYRLSNQAKDDLIRIHQWGVEKFGMAQADKYYASFFDYFEKIAANPYSFEAVDHIKMGYRRCVKGPDSIYFLVNPETVDIIAIIGKQDLNNKLNPK